jgi:DNA-binding YbaB/EbfC family protein
MNINPFEILKNAQKIQEQMGAFQQKLGTIRETGSAGGGMAEVDLNGRMEMVAVRLAPEVVKAEDVEMLQDLIVAAFTDAAEKIRERINGEMGAMAGSMGIPGGVPGFGFPGTP